MAIPRFIWNIVFFLICIAISLGIRNNFQSMIQSFVSILGYWTIPFGLILLLEHFLFRPRLGGYDLDNWQDSKKMPLGVAAVGTLLLALGLAFVGMKQVWVSPTTVVCQLQSGFAIWGCRRELIHSLVCWSFSTIDRRWW